MINTILISLIATLSLSHSVFAETIEVNFSYVGKNNHPALLGVKQGLEEANLQGTFLNQTYNLDVIATDDVLTHDYSKYIAVFSTADTKTFKKLSSLLTNTPIFNLTVNDDDLRTACIKNALHIIPSVSMNEDAVKQWKQKEPKSNATARAWHPSFVKFAARDLNKRFKKSQDVAMNDYSWAGWAAVKMTSDTVARTHITKPGEMLHYLKNKLSFDGQKGSNMNFRKTGQLRQPLLLVENDKVIAEAPIRGTAKPPTLDSLGKLDCEK